MLEYTDQEDHNRPTPYVQWWMIVAPLGALTAIVVVIGIGCCLCKSSVLSILWTLLCTHTHTHTHTHQEFYYNDIATGF